MTTYISNAFSLGMLPASPEGLTLRVRPIILEEVLDLLEEGFVSAVGHTATAKVLNLLLGTEVPCNRISISLSKGDRLIVFQIKVRLEDHPNPTIPNPPPQAYTSGQPSFPCYL
jgi:hypothetical protein